MVDFSRGSCMINVLITTYKLYEKLIISYVLVLSLFSFMIISGSHTKAKARYGSHCVSGYNSHYIG